MSTTYTNGTMKASRLSELEQVILRLAGKPQLTYAGWEDVSKKPYREIIAYMEKAQSHYKWLLSVLDTNDPIEAWAFQFVGGKPLRHSKCAALANEFESLLGGIVEHDQATGWGQPEFYQFTLQALLEDHIQALRKCAAKRVSFRYN